MRRGPRGVVAGAAALGLAVAVSPAAAAHPAGGRSLYGDIASYVAHRQGAVSVAVYDRVGHTLMEFHPGVRGWTASIVKVDILETLLYRKHGRLTSQERQLARRMIEQSDNNAATALWDEDDKAKGVGAYNHRVGLQETVPSRAGDWGLTTTSAGDQVTLVRQLLSQSLLTSRSRHFQRKLMRHVTPSQRWGVSAGPPAGVDVGLKNGWLPVNEDGSRWAVNSIGWIHGDGRSYVIAVITQHQPSEGYGIATIQHVARLAWRHAATG